MKTIIIVNDLVQKNYQYILREPMGQNFHKDFSPELTPKEMLTMGVFGGKYMTDCRDEFPYEWFDEARLRPGFHDPLLNYFGINAFKKFKLLERAWMDLSRGSPRLVSVVLQILHGAKIPL